MNPADNDSKTTQDHGSGTWLALRRADMIIKYVEFATLVVVFVIDRTGADWFEEKHLWWFLGGTLSLNVFIQSAHMFMYYVVNRFRKDKWYWPRVFPKEWLAGDPGSGFSQHYKFFYFLKLLALAYIGFMVFQEKLDDYFIYPMLFFTWLLLMFDLCYYLFRLYSV